MAAIVSSSVAQSFGIERISSGLKILSCVAQNDLFPFESIGLRCHTCAPLCCLERKGRKNPLLRPANAAVSAMTCAY